MRIITEPEFKERLLEVLASCDLSEVGFVTGPGRSGAVASVYASHILGVPYVPYGASDKMPVKLGRGLIIDTAKFSGRTLRKAERRYAYSRPIILWCYDEPPLVAFWYEATKPQTYRHKRRAACVGIQTPPVLQSPTL